MDYIEFRKVQKLNITPQVSSKDLLWCRAVSTPQIVDLSLVLYSSTYANCLIHTQKGWMASQCSFLCVSGRENNVLRNVFFHSGSFRAEAGVRSSLESSGRTTRPPSHPYFFPFYLLQLVTSPWLNLAEIQSLSIFEGLIIYFVDLFCLSFSTIRTWGSVSFY